MTPSHDSVPYVYGQGSMPNAHSYAFKGCLQIRAESDEVSFTVKFRTGPEANWQWVNDQFGFSDGVLIPHPAKQEEDLTHFLGLNPSADFETLSLRSESPGARLWSIVANVGSDHQKGPGKYTRMLGKPLRARKSFSLVRIWSPWLAPRHGKSTFRLTEDGILCCFLRDDGMSLVLVAMSGLEDTLSTFRSDDDGNILVASHVDGHRDAPQKFHVLAATAEDPENAVAAVMYEARKLARSTTSATVDQTAMNLRHYSADNDLVIVEKQYNSQWLEDWFDGLTYCTWNGLGQDLTEDKLMHALQALKDSGITVSNLIIDDNWQSLDNKAESQFRRGWTRFDANKEGFPGGLEQTTSLIREKFPNIEHIAVWHALLGYWGGISPDGELAKNYKTKTIQKEAGVAGGTMLAIDPDDVHRFYDDCYAFLSSAGVDSVKTDAQFFLDLIVDHEDRRRFTNSYQDAWETAHLRYFGAKAISCMSQTPQIMFHSLITTTKPRILLRNSDDFFPDVPSSHPWHIFCNAHNAIFTQHLNILPDWDMFQTIHPYSAFHAAARCVSGGPIYITDEPGKHDLHLIDQISARNPRGQTIILRPSCVGKTLDFYNDYNEQRILKVGTFNGSADTGCGILGLFNIGSREISSLIPLTDFPGIKPVSGNSRTYIVRGHRTGQISPLLHGPSSVDDSELLSTTLDVRGYEILTAYPVHHFPKRKDGPPEDQVLIHVAVLGLIGKMTGAAAIVSSDSYVTDNDRLRFAVTLKALGKLGVYVSDLDGRDIMDDFMIMILGKPIPPARVYKDQKGEGKVLAVDVQGAWDDMGLDAGWSNEVSIDILMAL